jgi:hypothetical protein
MAPAGGIYSGARAVALDAEPHIGHLWRSITAASLNYSHLLEVIKERRESSSFAVFDASGGNANVSLEYGYAEAFDIPRALYLSTQTQSLQARSWASTSLERVSLKRTHIRFDLSGFLQTRARDAVKG